MRSSIATAIAVGLSLTPSAFAQPSIPNSANALDLLANNPGWVAKGEGVRSRYLAIPVADFIQRHNLIETDPRSLASQLLGRSESLEGRQREAIAIEYAGWNGVTVVEYTVIGLPDDSVRSSRTRIELKWQQGDWTILWVGKQFQCHSGRGHRDWSGEPCL